MHGRLESVSRKMVLIFFKGNSFEFDPIFLKFSKFQIYHQGRFSFKYYKPCVHELQGSQKDAVRQTGESGDLAGTTTLEVGHQKHKYMITQMMVDLDWNERIQNCDALGVCVYIESSVMFVRVPFLRL